MAAQTHRDESAPDERVLLRLRTVARMFDISRSTVVRAYEDGELPVVKIRGTYRIPRQFVEDLLASARPGSVVVVKDFTAGWTAANGEAVA